MNHRRLALAALACLAAVLVPAPSAANAAPQPPNVLIVVTDDQTLESLAPGAPVVMPKLEARVNDPSDHWLRFDQAFFNTPLCCPSRATLLTGQYSHHTGVVSNSMGSRLDDKHTLATWLHAAGYRTGLVGKYLNHYPFGRGPYVPPGWDSWFAKQDNSAVYYNYTVNADGTELTYGNDKTTDYSTDVYRDRALSFIRATAPGQPLFLYFAPTAPHAPWTPAKRHNDAFKGLAPTRFPNFNEADISDKPSWVRALPALDPVTVTRLDTQRQHEYETLLSVDDAIDALLNELEARGILDDTVVFFLTDNGYSFGEHRYEGKRCEYDECLRTPFLVRYPGAAPGVDSRLVSNVDIAPTVAEIAGVTPDIPQDGVSLVPLLEGSPPPGWENAALIEYVRDASSDVPGYVGVRTDNYLYAELDTGEVELYETTSDPYELQNLGSDPAYATVRSQLRRQLDDLLGTDLNVTNTASPSRVVGGENVTFTVAVRNAGERTSHDVQLEDPFPTSLSLVSASSSAGTCSGAVACDLGDLAPGVTATVTMVATTLASGDLTTTATVTSATPDPNPANNEASASVTVSPPPSADLSIAMADSPDPVAVGSDLTYTLRVSNAGPDRANGVSVVDPLPAAVTPVSVTPSSRCVLGSTVTCDLGDIPAGDGSTVTIVVRPTSAGNPSNTASVSSAVADPNPANDQVSVSTTVSDISADLSLRVSDAPDPVTVGSELTYKLAVTNAGPDPATGITLTDTLPADVAFVAARPGARCSMSGGTVTCIQDRLDPGGSATFTIVVRPDLPGTIVNAASVSATTQDPDGSDNRDSATTRVSAGADLSIRLTDSPDPVEVDGTLTYTLKVANLGPSTATSASLSNPLPAGVTPLSAGAGCTLGQTMTCSLGNIAAGGDATVTITVRPNGVGTLFDTASVSSATADPFPGNNDSTAQTQVVLSSADLSLAIDDVPDPAAVGADLTYTLTVTNTGPDRASGSTLEDALPPGVTLVSVKPAAKCAVGAGTVTCTLGGLDAGASAAFIIVIRPAAAGAIINSAGITSTTSDPDPSNNAASAVTQVNPPPGASYRGWAQRR